VTTTTVLVVLLKAYRLVMMILVDPLQVLVQVQVQVPHQQTTMAAEARLRPLLRHLSGWLSWSLCVAFERRAMVTTTSLYHHSLRDPCMPQQRPQLQLQP
jgi:hypothetical protein